MQTFYFFSAATLQNDVKKLYTLNKTICQCLVFFLTACIHQTFWKAFHAKFFIKNKHNAIGWAKTNDSAKQNIPLGGI